MKLASISSGDIVLVCKGGRHFHATVSEISNGVVRFEPIERGISWRHADAHEIIDLWRHRRQRRLSPDVIADALLAVPVGPAVVGAL